MTPQQNLWYIPLFVAALAGIMSFLGTLTASFYSRRTEQQKWLRQERLQAYAQLTTSTSQLIEFVIQNWHHNHSFWNDLNKPEVASQWTPLVHQTWAAVGLVHILASEAVRKAALEYWYTVTRKDATLSPDIASYWTEVGTTRSSFFDAARAELGLAADKSLGFPLEPLPTLTKPDHYSRNRKTIDLTKPDH